MKEALQVMEVLPLVIRFIRGTVKAEGKEGVTFPHFRIMTCIEKASPSNADLAEILGVSVAAMSRMLDGLVRRGILLRSHSTRDRRQLKLELTPAGKRAYRRTARKIQFELQKKIEMLDSGQRGQLRSGMSTLKELFK